MIVTRTTVKRGRARPSLLVGAALAMLISTPGAFGFVQLGRGELLITGSGAIARDSNLFANASDISDTYWTVTPALEFTQTGGRGDINFRGGVAFIRFDEFSSEDTEGTFLELKVDLPTRPGARLAGDVSANYFDGRETDIYVNNRIDVERFTFAGNGSYQLSTLIDLRFGAIYNDYRPSGNPNNETISGRIGAGYKIRPQYSTYVDYNYGQSTSDLDPFTNRKVGHTNHSLSAGVTGRFSPFLTGNAGAGFQRSTARAGDTEGDANQFIANVALTWEPRAGTAIGATASSGSDVTNDARTIERIRTGLSWTQTISRFVEATTLVQWQTYNYRNEPDTDNDIIQAEFGLAYVPNKYVQLGIQFQYYRQSSHEAFRDYSRNIISGTASFRY